MATPSRGRATSASKQRIRRDGSSAPFNVFLRSPTISQAYNELIAAETAHTAIPAAIREIVILAVGVEWQSQYEIYAHTVAARACGISDAVIDAILNRRSTLTGTEIERTAYTFTRELVTTKHIGEATHRQTSCALGIRGVIDLIHLIGIYLTTSALLNTFDVPVPEDVIETQGARPILRGHRTSRRDTAPK
jgi:4-carboxymuconolactone decarboxylase